MRSTFSMNLEVHFSITFHGLISMKNNLKKNLNNKEVFSMEKFFQFYNFPYYSNLFFIKEVIIK
jgi:hypothetical protein